MADRPRRPFTGPAKGKTRASARARTPVKGRRSGPPSDEARARPRSGEEDGRRARKDGPRPLRPKGRKPDAARKPVPATPRPPQRAPANAPLSRIAKLLSRAGLGSRRDIERMVAEGRVALDGTVLDTPVTLVRDLAGVTVDGKEVPDIEASRVFLFYKPSGFLTTARDPAGRPTIYDILPEGLPRLMPVGRLDFNTEGLLLLTNDGGLKRTLELPATGLRRTYRIRAFGPVSEKSLEALALGVTIDGVRYAPADTSRERQHGRSANSWLLMTLTEGKNREVRKLCRAVGLTVNRLIRVAYGPFTLEGMAPRDLVEAPPAAVRNLKHGLKKGTGPG